MKLPLTSLISAIVVIFGLTLITDTQGRVSSSTSQSQQRTRSESIKSNSKRNIDPNIIPLLNKISALERQMKDLQRQVAFLKDHRHPYAKTRVDARCGWMDLHNFFARVEKHPTFKRDCGLFLGSTKPVKKKPRATYTRKPVK